MNKEQFQQAWLSLPQTERVQIVYDFLQAASKDPNLAFPADAQWSKLSLAYVEGLQKAAAGEPNSEKWVEVIELALRKGETNTELDQRWLAFFSARQTQQSSGVPTWALIAAAAAVAYLVLRR